MKKLFNLIILFIVLFSFVAEASVPLTKNNTDKKQLPKFIRRDANARSEDWERKHAPNLKAKSSISGVLNSQQMARFFEIINDERHTNDYLKSLVFITASTKWVTYVNKQLNYSIEYPDIFTKEIDEQNDSDELWIESSDGIIKLATLDNYNAKWKNAKFRLTELLYQIKGKLIIMEKENGNNWYRLVYSDLYFTVHRYGIVNNGMEICFMLNYPNAQSDIFAAVVNRMEQTLKVGE